MGTWNFPCLELLILIVLISYLIIYSTKSQQMSSQGTLQYKILLYIHLFTKPNNPTWSAQCDSGKKKLPPWFLTIKQIKSNVNLYI